MKIKREVKMNRIKEVREERGLRQLDVAKMCGIGVSTLWLIEQGYDQQVSEKTKRKIAAGLGSKIELLFPEE